MKRQLERAEVYSPLFEVNLCLRIPFEKNYFRESYQENNPESSTTSDYHVPEILSESLNGPLECDDEENAITQKLYTSSHQETSDVLGKIN